MGNEVRLFRLAPQGGSETRAEQCRLWENSRKSGFNTSTFLLGRRRRSLLPAPLLVQSRSDASWKTQKETPPESCWSRGGEGLGPRGEDAPIPYEAAWVSLGSMGTPTCCSHTAQQATGDAQILGALPPTPGFDLAWPWLLWPLGSGSVG